MTIYNLLPHRCLWLARSDWLGRFGRPGISASLLYSSVIVVLGS